MPNAAIEKSNGMSSLEVFSVFVTISIHVISYVHILTSLKLEITSWWNSYIC